MTSPRAIWPPPRGILCPACESVADFEQVANRHTHQVRRCLSCGAEVSAWPLALITVENGRARIQPCGGGLTKRHKLSSATCGASR
jgi:hypothetical protein